MPDNAALAVSATALPACARARNIEPAVWSTLTNSLFPGAKPESVAMVIDYCRARRLDPLKKPCHIVQMEVKDQTSGTFIWRDVILPGIYEHRMTAQRTGEYLGHSEPTWGTEVDYRGVKCFDWCALTMYRYHVKADLQRIAFPVKVFFREVVQLNRDGKVNARWSRAPLQMLLKCTEAAGLREAFPDELGGESTAEELDGSRAPEHDDVIDAKPLPPKPDTFDGWLLDMESKADEGTEALERAWKESAKEHRAYLTAADAPAWMTIKARAAAADAKATPATPPAADASGQ